MITYLIVPALTDQAGQCRIVARQHGKVYQPDLADYRRQPGAWREAGHMTSAGKLVALDGPPNRFNDMRDCEPLAAGLTFTYEE